MNQSICLVTGANNGIGFETAKALAAPEAAELTGVYYESDERVESAPQSYDQAARKKLWQTTLDLVGHHDAAKMLNNA